MSDNIDRESYYQPQQLVEDHSDPGQVVEPPLPFGSIPKNLPPIELSENAKTVLEKRYLRRGEDQKPEETIEGMFWRVAWCIAGPEPEYDRPRMAEEFYRLLTSRKFFPNSPTFTGAGTALGQLAACFVLKIDDDMGRTGSGIFQTLLHATLIQQTGGGCGFAFSRLRHRGALVRSSRGTSSGPIGFLSAYDTSFGVVAQGGTRRGANMAVLRCTHPDIRQFVTCKRGEKAITNFNISVGITDEFMRAVREGGKIQLIAPHTKEVIEEIDAKELWDLIIANAHHNGEPGILFLDAANRSNPVPHLYDLEATNPCGEQWLGPFENCCLGSVNLAMFFAPDGQVDWEALKEAVRLSARFLDNVVSANEYVPSVPQLKEAAMKCRRIGLGIMGLADLMFHCRVRYGSDEGEEFAAQIMEWVRYWAMDTSIDLAVERGAFPAIEGSIYDPKGVQYHPDSLYKPKEGTPCEEGMKWQPPVPLVPFRRNFGRPAVNWEGLKDRLSRDGIRNAAQTTVAPTGTIATVAGCEGYGCEPVFALAYTRHVNDNGKDIELQYVSPLFTEALNKAGLDEAAQERIRKRILSEGTCQALKADLPSHIRNAFVVSMDITAEEHVRMQAAIQAFVDNSMSKTCNLPEGATKEDVSRAYMMAWELGCKGLTVYVTGSRQVVVLETKKEADKKKQGEDKGKNEMVEPDSGSSSSSESGDDVPTSLNDSMIGITVPTAPIPFINGKKIRPKYMRGGTFKIASPFGAIYITINEDGDEPFECFVKASKCGSDIAAVSEAIGRLLSFTLRMDPTLTPRQRLAGMYNQLNGIGGRLSKGLGRNKVCSLPDSVANALRGYMNLQPQSQIQYPMPPQKPVVSTSIDEEVDVDHFVTGFIGAELCPDCGNAALINEEGCRKCHNDECAYSEC